MNKGNAKDHLPDEQKLEIVSPATRLLEKRRKMYENQEAYIDKKKEFSQMEIQFKQKEQDLRQKDNELQASLIQFASYLDGNQKAMDKCDKNIEKLKIENMEKDAEIAKKRQQLDILKQKETRIIKQKLAVEQYQKFLEDVREKNSDEYQEIGDILARYKVLMETQNSLKDKLENLDTDLKCKRDDVNKYEKDMETQIMTLNNDIAKLTTENEKVETEKQKLASQEEETSVKAQNKISELSRLFMAIDNLDNLCQPNKEQNNSSVLNYQTRKWFSGLTECTDFESYIKRKPLAEKQLQVIGRYLKDYKYIIDKFQKQQVDQEKLHRMEEEDNDAIPDHF